VNALLIEQAAGSAGDRRDKAWAEAVNGICPKCSTVEDHGDPLRPSNMRPKRAVHQRNRSRASAEIARDERANHLRLECRPASP
jgi:hypothetical protein